MRSPVPASADHGRPDEVLPRAFGRFVLFDHIGRGGMANIYLAQMSTDLGASRLCVVKEILPELSANPSFAKMLVAEAKLAAELNHANVVQVFDLGRERGQLYIAMEYVEGFDLHQLLVRLSRERVPLPASFALLIVREVLRGLDYAHRARSATGSPLAIVHRDVSPSNVLISFEGEVKLCDFGIARALGRKDADEHDIDRVRVAGKSAYMAPEHARGEAIDHRADLFAAGILLWELCAGRRLYRGSDAEMLDLARRGETPPLPDRGLTNHADLQALVARALCRDPDGRFATAHDMLRALEDYIVAAKLVASPLRFGDFLTEHFADEIITRRRERERAADKMLTAARTIASGGSTDAPAGRAEQDEIPLAERDTRRIAAVDVSAVDIPPRKATDETGAKRAWLILSLLAVGGAIGLYWSFFAR